MIELRVGGIPISIHPLMALLPPLGMALGMRGDMAALLVSLTVHEAGHLAAARLSNVRVAGLSVMPFGCGIQLGNLYALSPGQVLAVSAGGPLMSLALLFVDAALAHWGLLSPAFALSLLRVTLALLLFNLLPALPLDGGRMLYALTVRPLRRERAVKLGVWLGYATALALVIGAIIMGVKAHRLNLALPACAAFILKGVQVDKRALSDVRSTSLLNALKHSSGPVPMRLWAVDESTPILRALRHAAPDVATLYAVYQGDRLTGFRDEAELLRHALEDPASRVRDMKISPVA